MEELKTVNILNIFMMLNLLKDTNYMDLIIIKNIFSLKLHFLPCMNTMLFEDYGLRLYNMTLFTYVKSNKLETLNGYIIKIKQIKNYLQLENMVIFRKKTLNSIILR